MGVGKVHGEMEGRAIKWALEVSVYSWQPWEWRPPKPVYRCLNKKTRTMNSGVTGPGFLKGIKHQPQSRRKATHHWRWIDVLIPAWSMSARAIKVQAVHNRNPNEHNWEGGCKYFHSSHLPRFPSIFQLQLAFKYFAFYGKFDLRNNVNYWILM